MTARDVVLERVRQAVSGTLPASVPRRYSVEGSTPHARVEAFVDRVRDYRATVLHVDDAAVAVAEVLAAQGARRIGIPRDLDARLRPAGVELVEDDALSPQQLDELDGALTTCAAACAVTGTIALDGGPGQGRRALTLLPDLHICLVREEQIVETVPELIRRLEPAATEGRPLVLVSGPSATSDIELQRVEGVHGPRQLVVIVER
jgi:L-lactate dehydrogenase complex protein LldG